MEVFHRSPQPQIDLQVSHANRPLVRWLGLKGRLGVKGDFEFLIVGYGYMKMFERDRLIPLFYRKIGLHSLNLHRPNIYLLNSTISHPRICL